MATIDEMFDELIEQGVTPEQIQRRVQAMATKSSKDYFLQELLDRDEAPVVTLTVDDWAKVQAFLAKPANEQHHPQRLFQAIRSDIAEAIVQQDAQKLVFSLLLGVKAMQ